MWLIGSPCFMLLTGVFRADHYHCVSVSGVALFGSTKQNALFLCRSLPALLDPGTRLPPYPWLLLSTREPLLLQAGWKGKRGSGGTSTDTASGEKAECTGLCPGWFGWSLDVLLLSADLFRASCERNKGKAASNKQQQTSTSNTAYRLSGPLEYRLSPIRVTRLSPIAYRRSPIADHLSPIGCLLLAFCFFRGSTPNQKCETPPVK